MAKGERIFNLFVDRCSKPQISMGCVAGIGVRVFALLSAYVEVTQVYLPLS